MLSLTRNIAPSIAGSILRMQPTQMRPTLVRLASSDPMLTVGPYPRTKEERERAAKKYNLIPEDYEPYPEDHCWGDYPMLKNYGQFNRNKYDDFDDPVDYRYFGEPFHLDYDLYSWERVDPWAHLKNPINPWKAGLVFIGMALTLPVLFSLSYKYKLYLNHEHKAKIPGQKLYSFPPSSAHH